MLSAAAFREMALSFLACCRMKFALLEANLGGARAPFSVPCLIISPSLRGARLVMQNGGREGAIFLSHPYTNSRFFPCSSLNTAFYIIYEVFRCFRMR